MPAVSIIIPVYNAAKPWKEEKTALHRCLDSVLSQDFGDFELILVDDGSNPRLSWMPMPRRTAGLRSSTSPTPGSRTPGTGELSGPAATTSSSSTPTTGWIRRRSN